MPVRAAGAATLPRQWRNAYAGTRSGAAIRETAGAMVGKPGWMSPDEVARWIDDLRAEETD